MHRLMNREKGKDIEIVKKNLKRQNFLDLAS
jgi:hypothetical protein